MKPIYVVASPASQPASFGGARTQVPRARDPLPSPQTWPFIKAGQAGWQGHHLCGLHTKCMGSPPPHTISSLLYFAPIFSPTHRFAHSFFLTEAGIAPVFCCLSQSQAGGVGHTHSRDSDFVPNKTSSQSPKQRLIATNDIGRCSFFADSFKRFA